MNKAQRLNQELIFLSNKTTFQLQDLMTEFQISKRTALRDIAALEEMGLPYYTEPGRYGGYHLINQVLLTPIHFNLDEIRAIFFALNAMASLSSNPFEKSYRHIREKMLASLSTQQQALVDKMGQFIYFYATAPVQQVTDLSLILQAILEEKVLTGFNTQQAPEKIQLQVYELFYRNGIWFCSAQDLRTDTWGTYRCDYLTKLSFEPTIQPVYTIQDLKKLQATYETTYHNIAFRCQLTAAGKEHFLRDHYPNMHLTELKGTTYLTGHYNQAELDYMAQYLLSYGPNILVLSPLTLQTRYRTLLDTIQAQYK
ncbi:helix-turn-helix transcriptional regulator [Agrilactobacillus yilanensis]|uniref:Helix-turn-helix transcriptional regulator n=1 Tax=Agrilactobacillus yilanensis TaxID=2485997 RepID=A0ABW4J3G6_9LACO|nr:WYL domain-containing protein [Agrilactobacillus yilanensis]